MFPGGEGEGEGEEEASEPGSLRAARGGLKQGFRRYSAN